MNPIRWILVLCAAAAVTHAADDWQLIRFEGRDYIPLDNIARFYGFPPPPPVVAAPTLPTEANPPPQTAVAAPQAGEADATSAQSKTTTPNTPASSVTEAIQNASTEKPAPPGGHVTADTQIIPVAMHAAPPTSTVNLDNGKEQLTVVANSREARINGVKQWLAFPTVLKDGKLLVSRLDLAKTIEPLLRPEKIEGMSPVRTVILDPGHGGYDKGAGSPFGFEKDFTLDVALRVKAKLERRGLKVLMTRSSDVFIPLHERPRTANNTPDAIFVSIHFNSATSNPAARGFEIYSIAPRGAPATNGGAFSIRDLREEPANVVDTQSTALAASIFHSMLGHVPVEDRGLKHARFAVIRLCTKPSVLIECGFVSNGQEGAQIGSPAWRQKVADAIATGIENYKELAEDKHAPKVVAEYRAAASAEPDKPAEPPPAAPPTPPQQN
ncbi:N-acetylmuramoyl-L-alanine amidase [Verrucomicrobiota bacterium sgz303538]